MFAIMAGEAGYCYNKKTQLRLTSKEKAMEKEWERLPPGQHLTKDFPTLDLGIKPSFDENKWHLRIDGKVNNPLELTWREFLALPKVEQLSDFHCVTGWSKLDVKWGGVKFGILAEKVKLLPEAKFVSIECDDGYSTNLPLKVLLDEDVLLAYELEGEPLPVEHGKPVRLVVPWRYGYKSAKFVNHLRFLAEDKPGFWEVRGYHNEADPWKEQRHSKR